MSDPLWSTPCGPDSKKTGLGKRRGLEGEKSKVSAGCRGVGAGAVHREKGRRVQAGQIENWGKGWGWMCPHP